MGLEPYGHRKQTERKYGLVAEAHGYMDAGALKETLQWKVKEMAEINGGKMDKINYLMDVLRVPWTTTVV